MDSKLLNFQRFIHRLRPKQTPATKKKVHPARNTFHFLDQDILPLLEAHPDYLFCKDTTSTYRGCNERFAELLGLEHPKDIVGLNDYDLPWQKPGHRADFFRADDQDVLAGEPIIKQTEALVLPNQPARLMHVSKHPLRNNSGEIYGLFGIARDMTAEINSAACLEDLIAQGEQAKKSQHFFIDNITHSLRTPFVGLIALGEVLEKEMIGTPQAKLFANMKASADQLLKRINELITVANECKGDLTREPPGLYSPKTLLGELNALMRPLAQQKKLQLVITHDSLPPVLRFTHHTFLSVAINLVSNAINFTDKGSVHVHCALKDHELVFTVKDTGIGLSSLDIVKLEQPFFSVKPAYQNATGGLGLGLILVKHALKDNGGLLSITSRPKRGSCFTAYYPVQIPPKKTRNNTVTSSGQDKPTMPVLIVEDDKVCRYALIQLFKRLGVEAIFCKSAEEAIAIMPQKQFSLIITDIGLPGKSGIEFAEWVIKHQKNPPPIVALSAHINEAGKAKCLAIGMKAVYQKPISLSQLQALLKKYRLLTSDSTQSTPVIKEVNE